MQVYLETYGCQMNEYDSELVRTILANGSFQMTSTVEEADVVLLNTCAIRESAHERIYGRLGHLGAMKKNNVPVEYIVFPDEGHGFVKRENEIKGYKAILDFLEKYLRGKTQS